MKYRTKKLVLEVMEYTGKNENKFRKFINATAPIVLGMKKGVWALKRPDGESIFISKENLDEFFEPVEETVKDCNQSAQPTTNSSQLPKLTAEVFNRPDCPEWAQFAAVDKYRNAMWYEEEPKVIGSVFWNSQRGQIQQIPGKFDASDWQNSLIERPAKLPDWCKVGEWVYSRDEKNYAKVESLCTIGVNLVFLDGNKHFQKSFAYINNECVPARLRWWTASEAIGKVVADGESCHFLITAADDLTVTMGTVRIQKQTLLNRYRQPNGSPCGVLSHE